MRLAFLIVAVILFVLDAMLNFDWAPAGPWRGRLTPFGLAFFAASFFV